MAFCWPCSGRHCGWPVAPCCCIGANEPTGACGGPKCPSIACAGLSVSFGKPILHPWWAGTPIVDALTSPGPSVPYPGGLPFGTSADICSKTLLWVMLCGPTSAYWEDDLIEIAVFSISRFETVSSFKCAVSSRHQCRYGTALARYAPARSRALAVGSDRTWDEVSLAWHRLCREHRVRPTLPVPLLL